MVSSLELYNKLNKNKSEEKYYQVTRGMARYNLKGYDCHECQAFFKTLNDNQLMEISSRHRCQHKPLGPQPDILPINTDFMIKNQDSSNTTEDLSHKH